MSLEKILHYFDFYVYSVEVHGGTGENVVCRNLLQSLWQSLYYS